MKIGVISDTHDQYQNILKAVRIFNKNKIELLIHCGDWVSPFTQEFYKGLKCPIKGIFGNNDGDKFYHKIYAKKSKINFLGKSAKLLVEGKKMFIYHGENKQLLKKLINSGKYDVVFHGHTHIYENRLIGKTLSLNPGTLMVVTDNKIKGASVAIYETKRNTARIIKM